MRRFFCQYCGAEVPLNSDSCPNCGKEFEEVLCPKCNYTGSPVKFSNGCPKCGYLKNRSKPIPSKRRKRALSVKEFTVFFILLTTVLIILLYLFTH